MGRAKKQQTIEATLGRRRIEITVREKPRKKASPTKQTTLPTSKRSSARLGSGSGVFSRSLRRKAVSSESESESEEEESGSESESDSGSDSDSSTASEASESSEDMPSKEIVKPPVRGRTVAGKGKQSLVKKTSKTPKKTAKETPGKVKASSESVKDSSESVKGDETDDESLVAPQSARRQGVKRKTTKDMPRKVKASSESVKSDETDEESSIAPQSARRQGVKRKTVVDDTDDDLPPITPKRRRLVRRGESSPVAPGPITLDSDSEDAMKEPRRPASARKAKKPRSEKERARELLRRKRAGETIDELEESSDDEEEDQKPLYDSQDEGALHEFEDDEEGVPEIAASPTKQDVNKRKEKKRKKAKKERNSSDDSLFDDGDDGDDNKDKADANGDLSDFIDDDGPIGVPDEVFQEIPLEFTGHSHRPLKDHFRNVVEWIMQYRLNPGFTEKRHGIYRIAWGRLDDEVSGLATSKFSSSAWKTDFIMALRARPTCKSEELPRGDPLEMQGCGACGRTTHPARFVITFSGQPYYKSFKSESFLEPVEHDDETTDEDDPSIKDEGDEDEDGNTIPPAEKKWYVGSVCNSNAETAHGLYHWKNGLLEWVDNRLADDGLMSPGQLATREKMTPKQRYKLANKTIDHWVAAGTVRELYGAFSRFIEEARNKTTSGRFASRGGGI
ncbi:hypothetical protein OQA88_512 [Cercophora sp. LCS_1]